MVGKLVSTDDEVWHCFTLHLELTRIIFLDSISEFQIEMLEQFIEEFLLGYKEKFSSSYVRKHVNLGKNCNIIPKMHHLVHYPRFIRLWGPLKSFWCMRLMRNIAILNRYSVT